MATFFSIREYEDKATALETTLRTDASLRQLDVRSFTVIPGSPFAYWAPASLILLFRSMTPVHSHGREVVSTNPLNADFRFIRLWFEIGKPSPEQAWVPWAKGGSFSPYYYDVDTVILWDYRRSGFKGFMGTENRPLERPASVQHFFRPGLTWPRRTNGLSFRVMPTGCVFADKGPAIFVQGDDHKQLLALASIINSKIFYYLTSLQLSRIELAQSFEVGLIQQTPTPVLTDDQVEDLSQRARQLWFRRYTLDTKIETSHAFLLPAVLLSRVKKGGMDPIALEEDLNRLQAAVENTAFRIFGVSCQDRTAVESCGRSTRATTSANAEFDSPDKDPDELHLDADNGDAAGNEPREHEALLSWAVGVAFGRFDIHLATGERPLPSEPDPFDPLPPKSPGMLSDRDPPLHPNPGILVDDAGHQHDLPHLIDNVLDRVCMDTALDTRTWLRREFFPLHLMQYSKSRRKAPIYWPLSTARSGFTTPP